MKIKQIATVIAGALMVGATMGAASAASYPAQIVSGGVNVVVGTDGAEASDMAAATAIQSNLQDEADATAMTGATMVTGGEAYMIEKSSDSLNLGDAVDSIIPDGKLDDKDLDFLADGIYKDANNDEFDYSQKIYLSNEVTELIADKDYMNKEPTLGLNLQKNDQVLSYNITFDDTLNVSTMETSDLMIAGQEYYVLTATNGTSLTLLDTADSTILTEGESATVGGRDISIAFISSSGVKLTVDGETTNELEAGETYKLNDGSYVAIKEVLTSSRETTTQKVEFSIGSGKIVLEDAGAKVKVNDKTIDGLTSDISWTGADGISMISLAWTVDEDTFLTGAADHTAITMPVFGNIAVTYEGVNFADSQEVTELSSSDDYITLETEIAEGSLSLPILYRTSETSNFTGLGEDSDTILAVNATEDNFNITLDASEDTMFVVTYVKGDEGYTYAYQLSSIDENADQDDIVVELVGLTGESDITLDGLTDYADVSDITLTLVANSTTDTATINVQTPVSGASVYSNKIVTAAGLQITIPSTVDASKDDTLDVIFAEENADGDIAGGKTFYARVDSTDADGVYVSTTNVTMKETTDADMYVGYVLSELATMVEEDRSGDTDTFVVTYNGEEVTVSESVVVGGEVSSDDSTINVKVLDDTEAATATGNLVVVGGNCVNAVARDLLGLTGGDSCLADFAAAGTANGDFLIKSFDNEGSIALLVAGYSAADTTKAKNALLAATNLDVSVGKAYKAESTTTATATIVAA